MGFPTIYKLIGLPIVALILIKTIGMNQITLQTLLIQAMIPVLT